MRLEKNQMGIILTVSKNIIQHPSTLYQILNSYNIRTFFRVWRWDGLSVAVTNTIRMMSNYSGNTTQNDLDFVKSNMDHNCPESVPECHVPLVSIILPVYNQYSYTIACINSIIKYRGDINIEIIVGDDNSSDDTKDLENRIRNLKVVHNKTNLGFLLNCNNAAKFAKGKYLLFLNNDTLVKENWLSALVELAESDSSIGLVGSKFIYPDGSLQEAGGIIRSDGSAWNYGRGSNPSLPEFNYVKDVDYITGASILVPRLIFEKLGGFDERFKPAYCEDSDLAFSIRKLGYRTVFQPRSELIHFEGISNGKTVKSEMKSYQISNVMKFREKWASELDNFHKFSETDLFHARDRSFNKKTFLFIDSAVPRFDDNAGNRTVYDYMRTLVSMGCNVKFMPENFCYDPQYVPIYESMGIEVLYGHKYANEWRSWIKNNSSNIDYVMVFRPDCAKFFMKYIKDNSSATVLYNVADLHYVRLRREYDVTGNRAYLQESLRYQKIESKLLNSADRCVTVSSDEAKIMSGIVDASKIRIYPIFCYDDCNAVNRSYGGQHDLIFVGSFNHPPNRDAMHWFLDGIFPLIKKEVPDARINIIGSNATDSLIKLSSESVVFHNHVSDDELNQLYSTSSVCVIPLRFGAGVKGKTLEAMHNSIPIVSTSIGIEGMQGIDKYISPKETAEEFAAEVIRILSDREYAKALGGSYSRYVSENYSRRRMIELFAQEFGI